MSANALLQEPQPVILANVTHEYKAKKKGGKTLVITYKKEYHDKKDQYDDGHSEKFEWETLHDLTIIKRLLESDGSYSSGFFLRADCLLAALLEFGIKRGCGLLYNVKRLGLRNGYWFTLLSPLVLVYWAALSVVLVAFTTTVSTAIVLAFLPWALLFELPADVLNGSLNATKKVKLKRVITDNRKKKKKK